MIALGRPDAAAYLAALELELSDLASDEREDLLEEVEASLLEIDDDPVARLGSPERFAAESTEEMQDAELHDTTAVSVPQVGHSLWIRPSPSQL